jgi:hypothetical protein
VGVKGIMEYRKQDPNLKPAEEKKAKAELKKVEEKLLVKPVHEPKHHKKEEVKRKDSVDVDKLDPNTFSEKFKGFDKDAYEEIIAINNSFFDIGFTKYIQCIKK